MRADKTRFIKAKHLQLRRFRAALRLVLREAYSEYTGKIYAELSDLPYKCRKEELLREELRALKSARREAPLGCCVCGTNAIEDDLRYNEYSHEWYCEMCYNVNQEYYKKNPHPWLPCWKKLYP